MQSIHSAHTESLPDNIWRKTCWSNRPKTHSFTFLMMLLSMLPFRLFQLWTSVQFDRISLKITSCLVTTVAQTNNSHSGSCVTFVVVGNNENNAGPHACKWQGCCLKQIKWRQFRAASAYLRSQFLWHRAFRHSLSVSFVLFLIYSFQQPHSKTMEHKLCVELTSIIMQIRGKEKPNCYTRLTIPAPSCSWHPSE